MNKDNLIKHTESYHDEFIASLKDPAEAYGYLQVAIEEYQIDNDAESLLVALRNIADAQVSLNTISG